MKQLFARLEQASFLTEWSAWMKCVLSSAEQVDFYRSDSWRLLEPLSRNIRAMRWLTKQIRIYNPIPPCQPQDESIFYILATFCPDNFVLGYIIDTYLYYHRTKNNRGVLSCIRIQSLINQNEEYPHLNVFYNLIMGCVRYEYQLYISPPSKRYRYSFMTDKDFHKIEKYLPDFKPISFKEKLQAVQYKITGITNSEELARQYNMSGSVFRKRFKQEFNIPVSEWLRQQRKKNIEQMLQDTAIPLHQIAESNGFNMLSTFSDYCRRNFGKSPRQMRKELTEQ